MLLPVLSTRFSLAARDPTTLQWTRRLPYAAARLAYCPAYCKTRGNNEIHL